MREQFYCKVCEEPLAKYAIDRSHGDYCGRFCAGRAAGRRDLLEGGMTKTDHLLAIMAEECAEVAQRVTKALRFGLDEVQSGQEYTNAHRIMHEYADLVGVVEMLQRDLKLALVDRDRVAAKKERVLKYLRLSESLGRVSPPTGEST